jgi:hypothetical protein
MDLETAGQLIQSSLDRMRSLYEKPVFDEWMILAISPETGGVLAYAGPRAETYHKQFTDDIQPLRGLVEGRQFTVGDFEFAIDATGPRHDALLKVGDGCYLVCNNTQKTMSEIRSNPRWLKAQPSFFDLSEKFREDPLGT